MSFTQKIEKIQYNAALTITGAIKETSHKLHSELHFESLKLCTFFKIKMTGKPEYLFEIIPKTNHLYNTRSEDVTAFYSRTDVFKYFFFPSTISEWNKLDRIQQSTNMLSFTNASLKIGQPTLKPVHNILDPNGLKSLTRLRLWLSFSHLNEHKFNHNFKQCVILYAPVVCRLSLFCIFPALSLLLTFSYSFLHYGQTPEKIQQPLSW